MSIGAVILFAAVLVPPPSAASCTCLVPEGWSVEAALEAGAAFAEVTPLEERVVPLLPGRDLRVYTAAVHRALGLTPGATIDIATPAESAACGITLAPGERRWLALRPQPEGWAAELCWQVPLEGLSAADWDRLVP